MMEVIAFAQVVLTLTLYFVVAPLVATLREFREWVVYRGTWLGIFIQFLTIASVSAIVVFEIAIYSQETLAWVLILAFCNTAWFVLVRLARLVRDHC
jgi:hypothetical protein